jgi:hypothetical protein
VSDPKSNQRVEELNVSCAIHPNTKETLPDTRNHDGSLKQALICKSNGTLQFGVSRTDGKSRHRSLGTSREVPHLEKERDCIVSYCIPVASIFVGA